ncbi:GNAT family N-acetyltransferase [Synergistes jonesii]|uniref:GNAT family N-acetyltransferase n=1 Tax=Synergistes jonesii TaxID=2754 RepID=UPI00242F7E06|nr:GNAT family N-acetyltransferase [Synergistes jonesii]
MYDDDVRIRPAKPEDAEELADIAWRSKSYWDYPPEMMELFRGQLTIKQDFIERNPTYLIEHEETEKIAGFYALQKKDGRWWIEHLWVVPDEIGTGLGSKLFLHACEITETMGAEELYITSDPNAEEFYVHMGAERLGERESPKVPERRLPILRIKL